MSYEGVVLKRIKGFYQVQSEEFGELLCRVKGNLFETSRYNNQVAVGDRVSFTKMEQDDAGLIKAILPRKSFLSRTRVIQNAEQVIAANIDHLLIVAASKTPPLRHNLIQRMVVAANLGNVKPIIVITKKDLISEEEIQNITEPYKKSGISIIANSINDEPNRELIDILSGGITVLSGHSGVGKSALLNQLFPDLNLKVGSLIKKSKKGAHTTTYAEMQKISDKGYVIDTPGIREFALWKLYKENLDQYYPGFESFLGQCKHRDCSHIHEPECAVQEALKAGEIHPLIYDGYQSILESLEKTPLF